MSGTELAKLPAQEELVPAREPRKRRKRTPRKWSRHVAETSDALDLEPAVFKKRSARAIAASLKHSAVHSHRRKSSPFRSAMSMLTFYVNRAGKNLPARDRNKLERAKHELRVLFHRTGG